MSLTSTETESFALDLGPRGRLVLPAVVRKRLGLKEGDRLILTVEPDGRMRLASAREAARRARGLLREILPEASRRSLADELIEERRKEARGE